MPTSPVDKFKFVSPGVFLDEIDNTQRPKIPGDIGPLIIGRAARGPALRPVKVNSFSEFVDIFGAPVPGGTAGDVWRNGNYTSPMYAGYAVQAWLKNNSPVTFVRLLGESHPDAVSNVGEAGWQTRNAPGSDSTAQGGAYGLFIVDSASYQEASPTNNEQLSNHPTGALAAVWYLEEGAIALSGNLRFHEEGTPSADIKLQDSNVTGSAVLLGSVGANQEFKVKIIDATGSTVANTAFNFDPNSNKYIRSVFNTNPIACNSRVSTNTYKYWLGETFDRHLKENVVSSSANTNWGFIACLKNTSGSSWANRQRSRVTAETGWFFAQDFNSNGENYSYDDMQKLFKIVALDGGEWEQNNLKISIQDVKVSKNDTTEYGSFSVLVRRLSDNDSNVQVLERFDRCSFNPRSRNYIAKKIGNSSLTWHNSESRFIEKGDYPNRSKYIRVEMDDDVHNGVADPRCLPFGTYGPVRFKGFTIMSGSGINDVWNFGATSSAVTDGDDGNLFTDAFVATSHNQIPQTFGSDNGIDSQPVYVNKQSTNVQLSFTASYLFPALPLRLNNTGEDIKSPGDAFWGVNTLRFGSTTKFGGSTRDVLRGMPADFNSFAKNSSDLNQACEYSWVFSLDELRSGSVGETTWTSGSRAASSDQSITRVSGTFESVLDEGYDRFTTVLHGGFDGLNIKEKDPFNNQQYDSESTERRSSAYYSTKRAIDACTDPEAVEFSLASIPGLTNEKLTNHLLSVCEDRGDSLAVVDLGGGYEPPAENGTASFGTVDNIVTNLKNRGLNTSYGCAYHPWVQVKDTINDADVWMPPSVVALGVMSNAEANQELWFAPAGFTRGGLTEGAAGLPVMGVRSRLSSKDRDKLYEANINPIAQFPAEGIVIFGQKTLQITQSALDRINVRRLLIHVKKEISRMAATLLFDQNVQSTWNRFLSRVNPFLASIKARFGLTNFKVILDESTTTPDLVDRNIMYAKIFLKPARALEFIALDFVITDDGAAFED